VGNVEARGNVERNNSHNVRYLLDEDSEETFAKMIEYKKKLIRKNDTPKGRND
jgi:hypothetical protein